ncbi:MAG: N-acetylmuramoyl-L-alanine amidase [Magnetococcales bacterium]|nr:N-acetylmuramoyl-L-alanine amidase [Magnetococcales bacterium]
MRPDRRKLLKLLALTAGSFMLPASLAQAGSPVRKISAKGGHTAVIVIDPGHGGEDPGAVGAEGTREKDVVLTVAKKLAHRINHTPGFRAHLTRTGDYFVTLNKRVSIARQYSPDLFMSLHADAFHIPSARGASVYCLSERGMSTPDRAIKALVRRENSADLIGGVNLREDVEPEVAEMLMDLAQRDSLNRALLLGQNLLGSLQSVGRMKLHYKSVKQAGFAVLKAPDVPSVLVEMAFLSNPKEEELMRRVSFQETLADALLSGTRRYFQYSHRV